MIDTDVIRRSVTRNDDGDVSTPLAFYAPASGFSTGPGLPGFWSPARDLVLASTRYLEAQWANAIYKATTKMAALSWDVDDESALRKRRAHELFITADKGKGWVAFLQRHLADFLTTDNGAFVEIVRSSGAPGSKILGFVHLDSLRCTRTGDPEIPVLYRDKFGQLHELKAYQVIAISDMPNPRATWHGVGECAASRAYRKILTLASLETYVYEKVGGTRPLAIHILLGAANNKSLKEAIDKIDQEKAAGGFTVYRGAFVVPIPGQQDMKLVTIPLAELPDGFDAEKERTNAYLVYANSIGLDFQDLAPLSQSNIGNSTQSEVLDDKANGTGIVAWRQQFTHNANYWMLPDSTTFAFSERDNRDMKQRADISNARATFVRSLLPAQNAPAVITPKQALQVLVEMDELPKDFLPDETAVDQSLSDTEKPDDAAPTDQPPSTASQAQTPAQAQAQAQMPQPPAGQGAGRGTGQ